jgi:hypothetical protein
MECQVTLSSPSGQRRVTDSVDDREAVTAEIDGNDEDVDPLLAVEMPVQRCLMTMTS